MLKLIKYEFRKNRTLLLVILGIIAALEIFFLLCLPPVAHSRAALNAAAWTAEASDAAYRAEARLIVSMSLLAAASFGTAMAVFIMGVAGYSRELNQKTSYLIFMTPSSALSIVASKILFTLLTGVAFAGLLMGLASVDFPMMLDALGSEWRGYYNLLDWFMAENDLSLTSALLTIAFYVLLIFLSIIATVSIAYLAITLSATFMRGKKGHALISVLLFALLAWGNSRLTGLLITDNVYELLKSPSDMARILAPQMILDVAVLAVSLVVCAWMLKKRVDL
ncbi:MAG: hypothetical protein IKS52_05680 [Clostridia bacterium]|nr:hypothetical protein [Clostridia bacterium]